MLPQTVFQLRFHPHRQVLEGSSPLGSQKQTCEDWSPNSSQSEGVELNRETTLWKWTSSHWLTVVLLEAQFIDSLAKLQLGT